MTRLCRVLYCSRNLITGGQDAVLSEIDQILATSRRNNARDGITGSLLFSEGCFVQVLEGSIRSVEAAFERIQCDERHGEVTVLESSSITDRDFPNWSMAFAGVDQQSPLSGALLQGAISAQSGGDSRLLGLMKKVISRETRWLPALPDQVIPSDALNSHQMST